MILTGSSLGLVLSVGRPRLRRVFVLSSRGFQGIKRLNCDWVAEKRERCTESGIVMEEYEESEDDEDPNKPGPVEAFAFRACGKACGTCE